MVVGILTGLGAALTLSTIGPVAPRATAGEPGATPFVVVRIDQVTPATVTTTSETPAVTGNFVNPPFQNAKAVVQGMLVLTLGTGATAVTVRLRRNPNAENVAIGASQPVTGTAGQTVPYVFNASDAPIGPGPVQYQLTVQQTGASGNGTVSFANVTTFLISG